METRLKRCPVCEETKALTEFDTYFCKNRQKHRPQNYCKPCSKADSLKRYRSYYERNQDAVKQRARNYRADPKNKEKLTNQKRKFREKYIKNLQPCYVAEICAKSLKTDIKQVYAIPGLIEAYSNNVKIKRKIKDYGQKQINRP